MHGVNAAAGGAGTISQSARARGLKDLQSALRGEVRLDEPMSRHTTFRIGGRADIFIQPKDEEDLRLAAAWLRQAGVALRIIGNGSNLLVADAGFRAAVIKLSPAFKDIHFNGEGVIAGAGAALATVVNRCARAGWSGLESTVGIPGTIGGAIVTNAGTDTGSIGDLVQDAVVMDEGGNVFNIRCAELNYGYRCSSLTLSRHVVLRARLRLTKADSVEVRAKMHRLHLKRSSRQPLGCRSAGSVFKNPPEIAAGKLVDRAGCKGLRVGDAEVSTTHANFIINRGRATAADVRNLMCEVQERVLRVHGIWLEPEIELIGEW
ncbi:MAG: UDP-N-acetylmuramate dehydrogenase [Armatimonadota bacterium]|nr:MAG: UDP-N-acetylmuramate dehydrogenase [Armatimonadota bacterium]